MPFPKAIIVLRAVKIFVVLFGVPVCRPLNCFGIPPIIKSMELDVVPILDWPPPRPPLYEWGDTYSLFLAGSHIIPWDPLSGYDPHGCFENTIAMLTNKAKSAERSPCCDTWSMMMDLIETLF